MVGDPMVRALSIVPRIFDPAQRYRAFRSPRIWSNRELERYAGLFKGRVVNVSAWEDKDKEGRRYRDYFSNAEAYADPVTRADRDT